MKTKILPLILILLFTTVTSYSAPPRIGFHGNVQVNGTNFTGNGLFKFMIYEGTTVLWTNDGSTPGDISTQPTAAVTIAVSDGFYAVNLGDASITNMIAIPVTAFITDTTYLRIWFNDGTTGFELLQPDSLINSAPYALSPDNYSLDAADGSPADALFVDNSGRVGVSTTTPDAKLDIETAEDTEAIRITDSTNADSVGIFTGAGSPEGVVTAQLGSLYSDHASGEVYRKDSGDGTNTGWVQLGAGSAGSLHMAKMTRDAAQTGLTTNVRIKVLFDNEEFDIGGIADSETNDRFDIQRDGKYLVAASWSLASLGEGSLESLIYVNGVSHRRTMQQTSNTSTSLTAEIVEILDLSAGDYLEMYIRQNQETPATLSTSTSVLDKPRMSVIEIGGSGSLYVNDSGNVGIGTTTPLKPLHISTNGEKTHLLLDNTSETSEKSEIKFSNATPSGGWHVGTDLNDNNDDDFYVWGGGNGDTRLLIKGTGNVGIGTTAPSGQLHVAKTFHVGATTLNDEEVHIGPENDSSDTAISIENSGNVFELHVQDDNKFQILNYDESVAYMTILGVNGNVGINNSSPSATLDVDGDIEYTGTLTDVSDLRLKRNIRPLRNALVKIQGLHGAYFNMVNTPDKVEVGVIAQDVQQVLPEAVRVIDQENGYLGVSYQSLIPVLIEAIKELQEQINNLQEDIQKMKAANQRAQVR